MPGCTFRVFHVSYMTHVYTARFAHMSDHTRRRLYEYLGEMVRHHRKEASLTQAELAAGTQLSRSSIVNIEKGRQRPPLHVVWEIARELDVELHALLPRFEELSGALDIDPRVKAQIEQELGDGDEEEIRSIAEFVQSLD